MKTVADIAALVNGVVEGDGAKPISGLAGLREAQAGDLSLLVGRRYAAALAATKAAAVLVPADWEGRSPCPLIRVAQPDAAMTRIALALAPDYAAPVPGVHPAAVVADNVEMGDEVSIGPLCVVDDGARIGNRAVLVATCCVGAGARVGDDVVLHAHVSVREGCRIGPRTIIHDGAVIGSDGFGYVRGDDTRWTKIPQVGIVDIGADVEIGANTTIDRGRFGRTIIEDGVKIDNQVQVAHNSVIGANTAMAAQSGLAGSTVVGRNVQMGGKASAAGHLVIGDDSIIGGNCGLPGDVAPGSILMGYVARPHMTWKRINAAETRLPELVRKVRKLEQAIEALKQQKGDGPEAT